MAIKIITGVPGAGKTYFAVSHIIEHHCDYDRKTKTYSLKDGILLITNIEDMLLRHEVLEDVIKKAGGLEKFFSNDYQEKIKEKYPQVIYVIDEAQKYFHRKFYNIDVFYYFEYHRHHGHTIYLLTHHISKISRDIALLAETETRAVPRSLSMLGELKYLTLLNNEIVDRKTLRLKPSVYELYKSASIKEVEKVKNPMYKYIWGVGAFCVVAVFVAYQTFYKHFFIDTQRKLKEQRDPSYIAKKGEPTELQKKFDAKNNGSQTLNNDGYSWQDLSYIYYDNRLLCYFNGSLVNLAKIPYRTKVSNGVSMFKVSMLAPTPQDARDTERDRAGQWVRKSVDMQ